MTQTTTNHLDTMLRRLSELGIATVTQLEQAKQQQARSRERFSAILARLGILRTPESGKSLAPQLGWSVTAVDPARIEPSATPIAAELCRTHRIASLRAESPSRLVVATDDPFTVFAVEWLEREVGAELELVLVREQDLNRLLAGLEQSRQPPPPPKPVAAPQLAKPAARDAAASGEEEPIIRLVDSLLKEAVRMRASDIHVEPLADRVKVRYRIDGVLHDVNSPPKALQGPVTSRIKIMAGLNIAEKRLPQDGRLQLDVEGARLDVRLSTLPALHGESIVMRLLDRSQPVRGVSELGMAPADQHRWEQLIRRSYGMILVTGPTGSGKTTTLYATLAALNRPDRKLITLEDPVEYQLAGVNQVHIKSAIGLTFASGLRAILRQAPDIIMVGEIRDQETAQIAIQAALTGHLVFSTLHTNDASSAVTRLIDMGIAPFLVASTVQGVMAQRLVRRVCASCQVRRPPTPEEQAIMGERVADRATVVTAAFGISQVAEGQGCQSCHQSGYAGRVGIYELLSLSDALRQLVVTKRSASALRQQAVREGMTTLRDDAKLKIRDGLTTVAELLRVTSVESE